MQSPPYRIAIDPHPPPYVTVSRHFEPTTFWHHQTGAKMSGQFGTSAEVSHGHFGTGTKVTKLSRPPANIFATIGSTEEKFNITGYYY